MLNSFSGVGTIAGAPRRFQTSLGKEYYKFTLSIEGDPRSDGKDHFDRINCGAWGKAVEIAKYMEEGDLVAVNGPLITSAYKNEAGAWVERWEINAKHIFIIDKPGTIAAPEKPMAPTPPNPLDYNLPEM